MNLKMDKYEPWLAWAQELQFLAQAGLAYSTNKFDIERFERIRDIAAEIVSRKSDIGEENVKGLFAEEKGFQTPKIDTRAAIFDGDKILLVQESDGLWALPGGWCDSGESIASNTVKEVFEEAGLDAEVVRLIALHDRKQHNKPVYFYNIIKAFVLCRALGGEFKANTETIASGYFSLDELPPLAENKNNYEQIKMCFDARDDENWQVRLD